MQISFCGPPCFLSLVNFFGLVWLWKSVFRSPEATDDLARCGTCDYAVRGIESLTCPECGADLREVGIVTPTQREMIHPAIFLLLWPMLMGIPSLMLVGAVRAVQSSDALGDKNGPAFRALVLAHGICITIWIGGMILYFKRRAAVQRGDVTEVSQ